MYIVAIVGSQRKKGNTARLVQMIAAELETLAERDGHPLGNVTFYRKHGFEVLTAEVPPGHGVTLWTMVRRPALG